MRRLLTGGRSPDCGGASVLFEYAIVVGGCLVRALPPSTIACVDGTRFRSAAYPARLAFVRLRAAPGRAALVALGIAAGAAMLALAVGGSAAVRDRAVAEELARIGPSEASLQVVWSGVPAQAAVPVGVLDRDAR